MLDSTSTPRERLLSFVAELLRRRLPARVDDLAAAAGVNRAAAFRYIADIRSTKALPLVITHDAHSPSGRRWLVGVDWTRMRRAG